jgi:DNA invertase Pin-like site-specific DNA recombinase
MKGVEKIYFQREGPEKGIEMGREPRRQAYGYVRVSGKGQLQGYGPERQREAIEDFAQRNGLEIAGWFEDAHTGTEADRPQFADMLGAMMGNGVKTVVVESLDRLARDYMIQGTLLAKLGAEGLTLFAANTGMNVTSAMRDDPMLEAMVLIQGVFAQLDKKQLVRKLRKGREAKREADGRCEGKKPYGHFESEQAVLDRIHQLRRKPPGGDRMGPSEIAQVLNVEGYRNRSGGAWSPAHVGMLIRKALT